MPGRAVQSTDRVLFTPPGYCRKADDVKIKKIRAGIIKSGLQVSDPGKLFVLYEKLHSTCSKSLEVHLNRYLKAETESELVFLIHFSPENDEVFVQTLGEDELELTFQNPFAKETMLKLVSFKDGAYKCNEAQVPHILDIIERVHKTIDSELVLVPILKKQENFACKKEYLPKLLICFFNPQKHEDFIVKASNDLFKYTLMILSSTIETEKQIKENINNKALLRLIKTLLMSMGDIEALQKAMANEVRSIMDARLSNVFLIKTDKFDVIRHCVVNQLRFVENGTISEKVKLSGKILNIEDTSKASMHSTCFNHIDVENIKTILAFPIFHETEIIGVIEIYNKRFALFHRSDEEMGRILGPICGSLINQCLDHMVMKNCEAQADVFHSIMFKPRQITNQQVQEKLKCPFIHKRDNFDTFLFIPKDIVHLETECFVMKMFEAMDFFQIFLIDKATFLRFVLNVKMSHKEVPYHNWIHSFSSAHFAYLAVKNLQLVHAQYLTNLEAMAYFVSLLCHSMEYRGSNNPFQTNCNDFATLYSSPGSITERYCLSQFFRIIGKKDCNFLKNFSPDNYTLFLDLMKDMILSSDLLTHYKLYDKQYDMVMEGYKKHFSQHRYVFCSLLITCACLSDHTKQWSDQKATVQGLFQELITLTNLENVRDDGPCICLENVEITQLPERQIQFLSEICLPAFKLLAVMFPVTKELVLVIKRNILLWEASKRIFQKGSEKGYKYYEVINGETLEHRIEEVIQHLNK